MVARLRGCVAINSMVLILTLDLCGRASGSVVGVDKQVNQSIRIQLGNVEGGRPQRMQACRSFLIEQVHYREWRMLVQGSLPVCRHSILGQHAQQNMGARSPEGAEKIV